MRILLSRGLLSACCVSAAALIAASSAVAADPAKSAVDAALGAMQTEYSADGMRLQLGPRWSEQYGWAAEGRAGFMLSEAVALGLVGTLGMDDQELVVNSAVQINDTSLLMGTVGAHRQNVLNVDVREWVQQLEGGLSLRSDNGTGFVGGYEANVYATKSYTAGTLLTGTTYGAEANLILHPIPGMTAKLGAGYQRVEWDDGSDPTQGWTANLNVAQKLGDGLTLKLGAAIGQTEDRYSSGVEMLVANNSHLGLDYTYIHDRDGGPEDHRIVAYWRKGIGESAPLSAVSGYAGDAALAASTPHDRDAILKAVMEKPDYLPANVLAKSVNSLNCPLTIITYVEQDTVPVAENKYNFGYVFFAVDNDSIDPRSGWSVKINGEVANVGLTSWGDYKGTNEFFADAGPLSGTVTFTATAPGYSCEVSLTPVAP